MQVLVNGGSTHNFIQSQTSKFLQLPITLVPIFSVVVGNGQFLKCDGVCREVLLTVQGSTLHLDFFVLAIHGAYLVIGASWMAK